MLKVGDTVFKVPTTLGMVKSESDGRLTREGKIGTIIYVHSKQRFYVVEFDLGEFSFRESYAGTP